jgi:KDO2-lipid IV(A) lauroyltransferase
MAKQRSPLADYAVYLAVRLTVCVVQAMGWRVALGLAEGLAWLAHRLDKRHRKVAADNLRTAFPDWPRDKIDRTVRDVYRHFLTVAIEMIKLPRALSANTLARHVDYPDPAHYRDMIRWLGTGRPLIVLTGHVGNWEMFSYACGLFGAKAAAVARPLDNPYLDRYVKRFRQATGQEILAKKGDFDRMDERLAGGGILGILGDQDAGPRGVFVDFFGKPASTTKGFALMALEHDVPLLVVLSARVGSPMRYHLYLADVILPSEYRDRPDAVRAMTQRYAAAIEALVRKYPEQYFWLHRRWKTEPKARAKKAA